MIPLHLSDYLDSSQLNSHVENGWVVQQFHKWFPLSILTYSRQAVLENLWDDVTMKCRGLIFNLDTQQIVARPFEKFFNLNQTDRPETWIHNLPRTMPDITEKLDGSLGIGYQYNGNHCIASKASFHSDHAIWATDFYRTHCHHPVWPEGYTPIFEMICESVQHHVVHYGRDALILTALINNETGWEMPYGRLCYWADLNGIEVVKKFNIDLEHVITHDIHNFEGYVATWHEYGYPVEKVKIKLPEFLRLQRILHHVSVRDIFEAVVEGRDLTEWVKNTTPVFAKFVVDWVTVFKTQYKEIHASAAETVKQAMTSCTTRKEYAAFFLERDYPSVCFAMIDFDKKSYQKAIWKLVANRIPKGEQRFAYDPELEVE